MHGKETPPRPSPPLIVLRGFPFRDKYIYIYIYIYIYLAHVAVDNFVNETRSRGTGRQLSKNIEI